MSLGRLALPARDPLGGRDRPGPPRRADRRRELGGRARREAGGAAGGARPGLRRGAAAGRHRAPLQPPAAGLRGGGRLEPGDHQRHRFGQEPRLQPAGARRDRRRSRRPARSTSTRPRRWPRTRRASWRGCGRPDLREAIYDGDTPREERPAIRRRSNLVLTNPDMLHVGLLPHHQSWGDFLANLGWVVVDEAHTYRGVFGSHVANVLRRLRRVARAYGSEPRFLLASATIANPVELAERLVGTPFELIDDDGAPRAGREMAMWNPPLLDKASGARRSALSRGGRPAGRAGLPGRADDLLPQKPARDRADPALRAREPGAPRQAGAGGADRALPRRLHAAAAARDRGPARARRAARGRRDRRARAGHRRRRARRGDLRHLPRHRRQPAADVGPRGAAAARARRLRRRPGRARPVLLPPPRRVPRAPGRGGDPRPRQRADRLPAPDRRRLRAAAERRRRRVLRRRAGASAPSACWRRGSCGRPAARLAAAAQRVRRLADPPALGLGRLGRGDRARLGRDARHGRGRARLHDDPPRRDLPAPRPLLRGRAARRRRAAGDRLQLRRRLVHAAEKGDRHLHRADAASSARSPACS